MLNSALEELVEQFKKLPGVGEKTAQRFAFFLVKQGKNKQKEFAKILDNLDDNLHYCDECQSFSNGGLCNICKSDKRDGSTICIVESVFDIIALEKTNIYSGRYHVLHGVLSPIDGIRPQDLKITELICRVKENEIKEIIFALSQTLEGEATVNYIENFLPKDIKTTHIARGIPTGASLEYADEITLARAFQDRK